jgi:hypothetical protein
MMEFPRCPFLSSQENYSIVALSTAIPSLDTESRRNQPMIKPDFVVSLKCPGGKSSADSFTCLCGKTFDLVDGAVATHQKKSMKRIFMCVPQRLQPQSSSLLLFHD